MRGIRQALLEADVPLDVAEIDILIKQANSTSVYVVETINRDQSSYVISNELVAKTVATNQILNYILIEKFLFSYQIHQNYME